MTPIFPLNGWPISQLELTPTICFPTQNVLPAWHHAHFVTDYLNKVIYSHEIIHVHQLLKIFLQEFSDSWLAVLIIGILTLTHSFLSFCFLQLLTANIVSGSGDCVNLSTVVAANKLKWSFFQLSASNIYDSDSCVNVNFNYLKGSMPIPSLWVFNVTIMSQKVFSCIIPRALVQKICFVLEITFSLYQMVAILDFGA